MRRWIALMLVGAMFAPGAACAAEGVMATWLSPQQGQIVSGGRVEIAIGYNTQSKLKVSTLELYVDGQFHSRKVLQTPQSRGVCSFFWDTTRVAQGPHNLVVKVFAGDQVISKVYGTGTVGPNPISRGVVDVTPPVVTFANIKSGDVLKGVSTVKMNAADDSGQSPMVSLLVDNVLKLLRNTPPYQYDLDTTAYPDGDHSLKTYAYDTAGNRSDPAVANVTFRNGVDKPIVTTLNVNPKPAPNAASARMSTSVPPAISIDARPSIRESGRTEARIEPSHSAVAPTVAAPKPTEPKLVAIAPKPEPAPKPALAAAKLQSKLKPASAATSADIKPSHAAPKPDARIAAAAPDVRAIAPAPKPAPPALAPRPARMASAASVPALRKTTAQPTPSATHAAARPAIIESAQLSGVRSSSAAHLPEARTTAKPAPAPTAATHSAAPRVAEHKTAATAPAPKPTAPKPVPAAPIPSGLTRMAMAPSSLAPRATAHASNPTTGVASAPVIVDKPVSSSTRNAIVEHKATAVKTARLASGRASELASAAPNIVRPPALSKAALKRVRVAMAPDVRGAGGQTCPSPAIASPPAVPKSAKAKLEKPVVRTSGRVKARTFFEKMGGVLFWDPRTHTVTVCLRDMVLEMRIGSKLARVNGHKMAMRSAPYLVRGRTIFESGTFSQACALMESLRTVGKAEVR
jgi:hypothetical protein